MQSLGFIGLKHLSCWAGAEDNAQDGNSISEGETLRFQHFGFRVNSKD